MEINICRVCLSNTADKDFKSFRIKGKNISYVEVMRFCLGLEVNNCTNGSKLCIKCFKKVRGFYKFKLLALENDSYFNKYSNPPKEYKEVVVKLERCDIVKNTMFGSCDAAEVEIANDFGLENVCEEEIADNEDSSESYCDARAIHDIGYVKPKSDFDVNIIKKEEIKEEEEHFNVCNDDMLLSVMQNIKYEYVENESSKRNPPLKKVKRKKYKTVSKEQVCAKCGKSVKNIKEHMQRHLPSDQRKIVNCRHCDKVFSNYGARLKHEKVKHFGKKFKCEQCGKAVVNLRAHVLTMHERSSLKFKCLLCEKAFLTKAYLNAHMSTYHTKERTFKCEICDKAFSQKITLNDHRRRVHEKEKSYMCHFCSKSFFKKYHLVLHIRSHTKEKPYNCKECGRAFGSVSILKQHMSIHSETKNYQCTLCEMSFARHNYLRRHMVSHTKEKNYPCRYCGVKFLRSDHRSRHEFTAHQKSMPGKTIVDVELGANPERSTAVQRPPPKISTTIGPRTRVLPSSIVSR